VATDPLLQPAGVHPVSPFFFSHNEMRVPHPCVFCKRGPRCYRSHNRRRAAFGHARTKPTVRSVCHPPLRLRSGQALRKKPRRMGHPLCDCASGRLGHPAVESHLSKSEAVTKLGRPSETWILLPTFPHGLRRGLHSYAASRLQTSDSCSTASTKFEFSRTLSRG
jgi:hypothetical protein